MSAKGPKVDPAEAAKGLHAEQRAMLMYIYRNTVLGASNTPVGLPWQPSKWGMTSTPARKASCSRSLKRLEERGLVLRQNWRAGTRRSALEPHDRTTHVVLTEVGKAVSVKLSKERLANQRKTERNL
jgi:hypothetical protein